MLKIGVIDSGIGGISVVKSCLDKGINCEYVYLFDNKYHPYGERDKSELTAITFINVERLTSIGCDIILLACNTITGACIDDMRRTFYLPIVGTEPPVKKACEQCDRVAILATPYTSKSQKLKRLVANFPNVKIFYPDCSNLASAVEYEYNKPVRLQEMLHGIMARYLDCDGVALGCTHYNFLKENISAIMPSTKIFDSCDGVAKQMLLKSSTYLSSCDSPIVKVFPTGQPLGDGQKAFIAKYLAPYRVIMQ